MVGVINWIKGIYIWIRVKLLAHRYKIEANKILYAYDNLYGSFKNVKMILERCEYWDKDFCTEVKDAIKAKEMMEEYDGKTLP